MNKKFYYVICFICFVGIFFVSSCNLNETKEISSDTVNNITQGKLTSDATNDITQVESVPSTADNKINENLTIDKIKQSYKADEKILNTLEHGNYVLVESQVPTYANKYILYDLITGDKDPLPTSEYSTDSKKIRIVDANNLILYATGNNAVYAYQSFPFEIQCIRGSKNIDSDKDFVAVYNDIKFPINTQLTLRGKNVKEEVTDIKVTVNGIQVCFGPQNSDDINYSAAYVDCPVTDISYDETNREFNINFKNTKYGKLYTDISSLSCSNPYIESLNLKESENSAMIVIKLNDKVKYFAGKKDTVSFDMFNSLGIPYMDIQFFNSNMEFKS